MKILLNNFRYYFIYCRFHTDWLKEEFQKVDKLESSKGLSDKAKKYLKITHGYQNMRIKEPSRNDRMALQTAYGIKLFFFCFFFLIYI